MGFLEGVMNARNSQTYCRVHPPRMVTGKHQGRSAIQKIAIVGNPLNQCLEDP